jgi:hypothetical protein
MATYKSERFGLTVSRVGWGERHANPNIPGRHKSWALRLTAFLLLATSNILISALTNF